MNDAWVIQGRNLTSVDIEFIRHLIAENPSLTRRRLSRELCRIWQWTNAQGQIKDMACRTMLLKLERRNFLTLPPRTRIPRPRCPKPYQAHSQEPISAVLSSLQPLKILNVKPADKEQKLFSCLLNAYHYLGYKTFVGENMKYLVLDKAGRPLACLLFGAAAWKTAPRDAYIGWCVQSRQRNVNLITNNTRFLILPWVKAPHLASHILALVARRVMKDWIEKYNHPVWVLETFVDTTRFKGTCYKAANWIYLGRTKGRTRQDRFNKIQVAIKDIYLYPLHPDYKKALI